MMNTSLPLSLRTGFLCMALTTLANFATATPIVYTDRTAFNAATTGTTTVDFEGENAATFREALYTISGTSFAGSTNRLFTLDAGHYSPTLASDYLNMNNYGTNYIEISAANMTAIGFDFGTLNSTFGASTAVAILDSLGNIYNLNAPDQPTLDFIGFTSDVVLTSVRVTGEFIVLDNVTTGSAAVVPEPATLALLALALVGLGATRRRKTA